MRFMSSLTAPSTFFARYRIALGWPAVGMGSFMRIVEAPGIIRDTLMRVAGGALTPRPCGAPPLSGGHTP